MAHWVFWPDPSRTIRSGPACISGFILQASRAQIRAKLWTPPFFDILDILVNFVLSFGDKKSRVRAFKLGHAFIYIFCTKYPSQNWEFTLSSKETFKKNLCLTLFFMFVIIILLVKLQWINRQHYVTLFFEQPHLVLGRKSHFFMKSSFLINRTRYSLQNSKHNKHDKLIHQHLCSKHIGDLK